MFLLITTVIYCTVILLKKIDSTGKTKYENWLVKHKQLIQRSKEDFVEHYKNKYGLPLPIWVAIELWDFGLLSTFYEGMSVRDKENIAVKYGVYDFQVMESWLRCLNYVRNVAAHHSRLWNRNLVNQPKLAKKGIMPAFDSFWGDVRIISRIYIVLCILSHLMNYICPKSTWRLRVVELVRSFPNAIHMKVKDMGFPNDWMSHEFWENN